MSAGRMPQMTGEMKRQLARDVSEATEDFGLALGGSYALELYGLTARESHDMDWFADRTDELFGTGDALGAPHPDHGTMAEALVSRLEARGYEARVIERRRMFASLSVVKDGYRLECDLTVHARIADPVEVEGIRVCSHEDAEGGKLRALARRSYPRDFIDAEPILRQEGLSADDVAAVVSSFEGEVVFGDQVRARLAEKLASYDDREFLAHVDEDGLRSMRGFYGEWLS